MFITIHYAPPIVDSVRLVLTEPPLQSRTISGTTDIGFFGDQNKTVNWHFIHAFTDCNGPIHLSLHRNVYYHLFTLSTSLQVVRPHILYRTQSFRELPSFVRTLHPLANIRIIHPSTLPFDEAQKLVAWIREARQDSLHQVVF